MIELVAPLDKEKLSPVDVQLRKIGPTAYHLCFRSDDLDEDIQKLKENGYRVVIAPASSIGFNGKRVVFLANLSLGLIEVVEA